MLSIFTLPSASTIISSTSDYSGAMFTELLPLAYIVVGLIVAGLLVRFVMRAVLRGIKTATGGGRGRGRRRR